MNRISYLEKDLIEKYANNNASSVNKTVIENNKIIETERGNSSPSSNS